jgi:hypothetical protein
MTILWGSFAGSSWICRKHENDEELEALGMTNWKSR